MMNKITLLLMFAFVSFSVHAQTQVENILRDAKLFNKANLELDFNTVVDMTVPSIVKLAGGKEIMVNVTKEQFITFSDAGITFISYTPLKPSKIMIGGSDLHSILPQEIVTKVGDDKFKKIAYYLASSNDEGKTWTFVDLEPYDAESIKIFVPSFSGALEIPSLEPAVKIEK